MEGRRGDPSNQSASKFLTIFRHWIWDSLYLLRNDKSQFGEQGLIEEHMWSDYESNPTGFFLELGGNQPVKCSNTYIFSKIKSGGGTSVDANRDFSLLWKIFRKRDLFLAFAIVPESYTRPTVTFYNFEPKLNLVSSTNAEHAKAWKRSTGGGGVLFNREPYSKTIAGSADSCRSLGLQSNRTILGH